MLLFIINQNKNKLAENILSFYLMINSVWKSQIEKLVTQLSKSCGMLFKSGLRSRSRSCF